MEGPGHRVERSAALGASALLVAVTIAGFAPVLVNDFVNFDDPAYVLDNEAVRQGITARSLRWAWTSVHAATWQPVTWMSHMLDHELFGANPRGHHASSLILHLAVTLLLFRVLERATGATFPAAFAAALFAVHPLHVEPVAWVAGRKDLVCGLFWMLGMLAWLRWVERPSVARYGLVLLAMFFGLASKPMIVTFPLILLLLDVWPLRRWQPETAARAWALVREKLPLAALSLASSAIAVHAQHAGQALRSVDQLPVAARLTNAIVSYAIYLVQTVRPLELAAFYPHPGASLSGWRAAGAAAVLVAITVAAIRLRRRAPYLAFGWAWYGITLLPVIGLIQVGSHARADRFTYVPLIGVFVAVGWGADALARSLPRSIAARRIVVGAAIAIVLALLPATRAQVRTWRSSETLFRHALAVTDANATAHNSLGSALVAQGHTDEALAQFREAVRINPRYGKAHNNLGVALAERGRHAEAETHYRRALRIDPEWPRVRVHLGNALKAQGRFDEAYEQYREAIRLDASLAQAHFNLGVALAAEGRTADAIEAYRRALRIDPADARTHNNLGNALARIGETPTAIGHLARAIELDPGYARAHANLAAALFLAGRHEEAWREVRAARSLGFEPPPSFVRALAEAHPDPLAPER